MAQLREPISTAGGVAWLGASVLVVTAAITMPIGRPSWWWALAGAAAVLSQALIISAWSDAKAGTLGNILLLLAAVYGFLCVGPTSPAAEWRRAAEGALADTPTTQPLVIEEDLTTFPTPWLPMYVRRSGAVGQPRTVSFRS